MKTKKKALAFIMALLMAVNFLIFGTFQSFAHSQMLDVGYDNCQAKRGADGIDEMWYILKTGNFCVHYPETETTIKYYFEDSLDGYTWTTGVSATVAQEIKDAYANSMKKWNNVYFYSRDSAGIVEKHQIINIIEGTASDHDISIYPIPLTEETERMIACAVAMDGYSLIESGATAHEHYTEWEMQVSVSHFYVNDSFDANHVDTVRRMVGAHEFGHVLGLFDLDKDDVCHSNQTKDHHEEVIMGYGDMSLRSINIQYKDIAGAAITRGFHTDEDHKWLNAGLQSDGQYKLICTICNGIKRVVSLGGYSYNTYGACNDQHNLSSNNMMAVASYGDRDYYKCKYCRYVASYYSNMPQRYTKTNAGPKHKCVNTVTGLGYTFYEAHSIQRYIRYDNTYHYTGCVCGFVQSQKKHIVRMVTSRTGVCMQCDAEVIVDNGTISPWSTGETVCSASGSGGWYLTENGSYVLPNGVIVLVPEDVEGYLTGEWTLPDDFPWSVDDYEPILQ